MAQPQNLQSVHTIDSTEKEKERKRKRKGKGKEKERKRKGKEKERKRERERKRKGKRKGKMAQGGQQGKKRWRVVSSQSELKFRCTICIFG